MLLFNWLSNLSFLGIFSLIKIYIFNSVCYVFPSFWSISTIILILNLVNLKSVMTYITINGIHSIVKIATILKKMRDSFTIYQKRNADKNIQQNKKEVLFFFHLSTYCKRILADFKSNLFIFINLFLYIIVHWISHICGSYLPEPDANS